MNKLVTFGFCLVLSGCVVSAETTTDEVSVSEEEEKPSSSWYEGAPSEGHDDGCGFEVFELPDGHSLRIPLECAPFYIYKGMPSPEDDIFPGEKEVSTQEIE